MGVYFALVPCAISFLPWQMCLSWKWFLLKWHMVPMQNILTFEKSLNWASMIRNDCLFILASRNFWKTDASRNILANSCYKTHAWNGWFVNSSKLSNAYIPHKLFSALKALEHSKPQSLKAILSKENFSQLLSLKMRHMRAPWDWDFQIRMWCKTRQENVP